MLLGVPATERRERSTRRLEAVGSSNQGKRRPNQLSGGQKQRVAVAHALVKGRILCTLMSPLRTWIHEREALVEEIPTTFRS